ncbi:hypothetical protein HBH98_077100 [Parastagonospora nodorum]|nr:hypothetical protein HBH51_208580 [Parastagonospora nodorum]KAH4001420.1 hypothetical protein HBI10_091210 [Parastagonospora nodorum]KAH4027513.1 hypothetical protein HBI13_060230 [Parastagonospora nodorum]KAH4179115.1 hypothetical protein HBH43_012940 [Parastagonospora nodorum]KAH4299664.1 hypothetical protein HBI01_116560 [Parastagonospora nodorum]
MRLLTYDGEGSLILTRNLIGNDEVPPYAILSHTWVEGQEVTFDEFESKQGKSKSGYDKIVFCAQRAKLDGLDYFWVDTCCIDKKNSTELTEAINSMFKWYRNAIVCYAYLTDVPAAHSSSTSTDLQNSRWFKRGWTLQELIAPTSVQFFDKNGSFLGDRVSLQEQIAGITGIPSQALQGTPLEMFKIDERKRWARQRETKLEEDQVYSLLGLLGIYMPLIYGEGRSSALRRLSRELKEIQIEDSAGIYQFTNMHWMVPSAFTSQFTGRSKLLERLQAALIPDNTALDEQTRIVITGMGGMGKSEVCIKLANLVRESFWGVFWVDVSSQSTAQNGFAAIATMLQCPTETISDSTRLLANATKRWLLVLDNADDPLFDYAVYLPPGNRGSVVLTSRSPECKRYSTIEAESLEGLGLADSTQLLLKAAQLSQEPGPAHVAIAQEVVHELGSHTLAIVQAGAYIAEGYCRLEQYPQIFRDRRKQLLEHHPNQQQSRYRHVYATFEASVTGIENHHTEVSRDAIDLLAILAMLHANALPVQIFEEAWMGAKAVSQREPSSTITPPRQSQSRIAWRFRKSWNRHVQNNKTQAQVLPNLDVLSHDHVHKLPGFINVHLPLWNDHRLKHACSLLTSLSLVKRNRAEGCDELSMHPLAHAWAKDRLGCEQQQRAWLSAACTLILSPPVSHEAANFWKIHEKQMLPHMQSLIPSSPAMLFLYGPRSVLLPLLVLSGTLLNSVRDYIRLQALLEAIYKDLGVTQYSLPTDSPTLWVLTYRAALQLRNTRLAITLLEHITTTRDPAMKLQRLHDFRSRHDLAQAYNDVGEPERAVPLLEGLVETYKLLRYEGEYHDYLADTQYELTRAYNLTGQTAKAVSFLGEVVKSHKRTPGQPASHSLLRAQHVLAIAYATDNQTKEALALLEDVVKSYKTILPETHSDYLLAQQELGRTYGVDGQLEKSLQVLQHVVTIHESNKVRTDYKLLAVQCVLADTFAKLDRHEEALKLRKQVVEMYRMILEETHPDRLRTECALALSYVAVGERKEALEVMRCVVEVRRRILDSADPLRVEAEKYLQDLEDGRV